jgi:hypothetical protein
MPLNAFEWQGRMAIPPHAIAYPSWNPSWRGYDVDRFSEICPDPALSTWGGVKMRDGFTQLSTVDSSSGIQLAMKSVGTLFLIHSTIVV